MPCYNLYTVFALRPQKNKWRSGTLGSPSAYLWPHSTLKAAKMPEASTASSANECFLQCLELRIAVAFVQCVEYRECCFGNISEIPLRGLVLVEIGKMID